MNLKEAIKSGKNYRHPKVSHSFGKLHPFDPLCFQVINKGGWTYFPGTPQEQKFDSITSMRGSINLDVLFSDEWEVEG